MALRHVCEIAQMEYGRSGSSIHHIMMGHSTWLFYSVYLLQEREIVGPRGRKGHLIERQPAASLPTFRLENRRLHELDRSDYLVA